MTQPIKCYSYIRFSTPDQEKKDSRRRQIGKAEKWAERNGIKLDDALRFEDLGLSAFKGYHRTKGALGKFLDLIEEDKIPKGSILIVEAMDRLSREEVFDATYRFMGIINAGIKIVTLIDEREYDKEAINKNPGQFISAIQDIAMAHKESAQKSYRLIEAWIGKRQEINKYKLTARAPAWLKPVRLQMQNSEEKGPIVEFVAIKKRVDIIERIFKMKLAGKGAAKIEKELNQTDGIWKSKNGWQKSYINKILRDRSVIGEYQPHKMVKMEQPDGTMKSKRVPEGEPIKEYYPDVVSEDLFYQVQNLIKKNQGKGGKNGVISNLFPYISVCGYCGSPMRLINKGRPPQGQKYYVCDNAERGVGCHRHSIRYEEFEKLILIYCKGLNPEDIMPDENHQSELASLTNRLDAINGELSETDSSIKNLERRLDKTEFDDVAESIEKRLHDHIQNKKNLERQRKEKETEFEKLSSAGESTQAKLKSMRDLFDQMEKERGQELVDLRTRLREVIRRLINEIIVYPVGNPRWTEKDLAENGQEILDELRYQGWKEEQITAYIEKAFDAIDNTNYRTFAVHFDGGGVRIIKPNLENQLAVDIERTKGIEGIPVYIDMSIT